MSPENSFVEVLTHNVTVCINGLLVSLVMKTKCKSSGSRWEQRRFLNLRPPWTHLNLLIHMKQFPLKEIPETAEQLLHI